jgi:hypothetical protein
MRKAGAIALIATVVVGLVALAGVAARDKRDLAFTIGVVPTIPAAKLNPGATVCQSAITVPDSFTRVRLRAGTTAGPGQPLDLNVREVGSNRTLAHGRLPGGYPDPTEQSARVGRVAAGKRIAVCIRNVGRRNALVYGNAAGAAPPSQASLHGRTLDTDLTLVFLGDSRRSMLTQLPDLFQRASVFRPGWVGPWTFWVLAVLVVAGVPLLLARALRDCGEPVGGALPERRP